MKNLSIIIVLFSIVCIGCERQVPCPSAFSVNYFPYAKGQNLKYINNHNDTLIYTITNEEIYDGGFATKGGGINNKGNYCCSGAIFFINSISDKAEMNCEITMEGSADNVWEFTLRVYLKKILYNNERLEIVPIKSEHWRKKIKYSDMSKYLEDTLILENENNKIVKKMVIVKGKGIVSYTTADGVEWKLVE